MGKILVELEILEKHLDTATLLLWLVTFVTSYVTERVSFTQVLGLGHCHKYSPPVWEKKGFSVADKTQVFHLARISAPLLHALCFTFSFFCVLWNWKPVRVWSKHSLFLLLLLFVLDAELIPARSSFSLVFRGMLYKIR